MKAKPTYINEGDDKLAQKISKIITGKDLGYSRSVREIIYYLKRFYKLK